MSKFFVGSSDEEEVEKQQQSSEEDVPAIKVPSRFAKTATDDVEAPSDEPTKRVVKSSSDKQTEELKTICGRIRNHMKKGEHGDWNAILDDFDKLNKQYDKSKQLISKKGVPNFYIRILVQLEDFLKQVSESKTKSKMNAANTKNFNTAKQKIKKYNKTFEEKINTFRKSPPPESDEEEGGEEEEGFGSDEDTNVGLFKQPTFDDVDKTAKQPEKKSAVAPAKKQPEKKPAESDEETSEQEEDEEDEAKYQASAPKNKWLKDEKTTPKKPEPKEKEKEKVKKAAPAPQANAPAPTQPEEKKKEEKKELNEEQIRLRLVELLKERGKRNTDPKKQAEKIAQLLPHAEKLNFALYIEVLTQMISAQFDVTKSIHSIMPHEVWRQIQVNLNKMLTLIEAHPELVLPEPDEPELNVSSLDSITSLTSSVGSTVEDDRELPLIGGNLMSFVERLDLELTKRLRNLDAHSPDYVPRLLDEALVLGLAERAQAYYERVGKLKRAARMATLRVEHLYYKQESQSIEADKTKTAPASPAVDRSGELKASTASVKVGISKDAFDKITQVVYNHGDQRSKTRTMICQIYYEALHDRFYQARDMMLMSRIQDSISSINERQTQILFNRAMVQLGLSAFRNGLIKQAHSCLSEMYSSGRIRELLAQPNRHTDKKGESDKPVEKLPYHMHINLEVTEAVHLICALLLEVPNMAANEFDPRKKIISRTFRRHVDHFEKQMITGPPETTRDMIVNAAKALGNGEWKRCEELLLSLSVWSQINNSEQVKAMLKRKIQEEALRTYIFTFSKHYDSLGLEQLSQMFELPKNVVHATISKMMISEELHASWDQPTGSIIIHHVDATRLQYLTLQFSDKISQFVENNDRLLAPPTPGTKKEAVRGGGQRGGSTRGRREGDHFRGGDRRQRGDRQQGGGDRRQRGDRQQGFNQRDRGGYQRRRGRGGDRHEGGGGYQQRQQKDIHASN